MREKDLLKLELLKENIQMEKKMEKEKNMSLLVKLYLMVNLKMEKNGQEKDMIKISKLYMN